VGMEVTEKVSEESSGVKRNCSSLLSLILLSIFYLFLLFGFVDIDGLVLGHAPGLLAPMCCLNLDSPST
jgi:hypothetical protein